MTETAINPLPTMSEAFTRNLAARTKASRQGKPDGVGDGVVISEGARNNTLTSLAGAMRRPGMTKREIAAALHLVNQTRCDPPLPATEVDEIAASISTYPPADAADPVGDGDAAGGRRPPSQATRLVELAGDARLFHDAKGEAYATFEVAGHIETWAVRSKSFKQSLLHRFFVAEDAVPGAQAVQDALGVLEAKAKYEGPEQPVHLRTARHAGEIYLDMCDEAWRVVRIRPTEWEVVDQAPVVFRRGPAMQPLPDPERGGTIDELRPFINVADEVDWQLIVGFLCAALVPGIPYPLLVVTGEQGSAKSSLARIVKALIDPNAVPLRAASAALRDLMITTQNQWLLALDNLSRIKDDQSDDLCRLATGGGISTRRLYTDEDEVIFEARRPVVINGIEDIATRPDLLDRSLCVHLPPIPESQRRDEREMWLAFETARPRILAGLLDALVSALATIERVTLPVRPRMADLAEWVTAAEPALGWPTGTFLAAMTGNRTAAREVALDASPITPYVIEIARTGFAGTAQELLDKLTALANARTSPFEPKKTASSDPGWPKNARDIGGQIRRLAPDLRTAGLTVEIGAKTSGSRSRRILVLRMNADPTDATDASDASHAPG